MILEYEVEQQKERAATAEKDLLLLKEESKPRSLSSEIAGGMAAELKKYE